MTKALFFDLDDTLLNSEKVVSERNKQAIIRCSQNGYKIGYISVRSPRKIRDFLSELPCDCIAQYNGASIYAENKLIAENVIKHKAGIDFISKIREIAPDIKLSAYFEPLCYRYNQVTDCITGEKLDYDLDSASPYDFQRLHIILDGYEGLDFSKFTDPDMLYQTTVHNTAVVTNTMANKGNAVKTLMKYFNLRKDEVISFGDDLNDIEMLKASGTGVAMGNALKEVKAVADFVTLTNDEDGVAEYIEKYLL